MRKAVIAVCALLIAAVLAQDLVPIHRAQVASDRIDGEYIVVFKASVSRAEFAAHGRLLRSILQREGDQVIQTFAIGSTFKALHVKLSSDSLEKMRTYHQVDFIEEHQIVRASVEPQEAECTVQNDVIWNLARLNEHKPELVDDQYEYGANGEGVDVYVVDTGVQCSHVEFEGRCQWGTNTADTIDRDCHGHGTHVAGTVAGRLYGVAKKANIIAVKVLGCNGSGTNAGVIQGVQWVANQGKKTSVANMSLGGGFSAASNAAVNAAVDAGVVFAVAAGNDNRNACNYSPASAEKAISVGATTLGSDETDERSYFSNFGTCVSIFAPGQLIKSAWIDQAGQPANNVYNTISGTSMASPHVAGVAAVIRSANPQLTPAEVEAKIVNEASNGVVDLLCAGSSVCLASPNKLLYSNC